MQAQANRMARLIDDLLSLSRIELNAHLRPDKEVDLVAILRQVVDGLQTLARIVPSRFALRHLLGSSCAATATNCCGCSTTWSRTR